MFWQDDEQTTPEPHAEIINFSYAIACKQLPVDHAWELSEAIIQALPWLKDEPQVGIHQIHVAASQNGWERPAAGSGQMLCLSRRTRLVIRIPEARLDDAKALSGKTLSVSGHEFSVGKAKIKPLVHLDTVFSRYLQADEAMDENSFLQMYVEQIQNLGIKVRKALCGISHDLHTPEGIIPTRSLMLADLNPEESLKLQREGLGSLRLLGCGIFNPHKGIDAVGESQDDSKR